MTDVKPKNVSLLSGAFILGVAIVITNYVPYGVLIGLWLFAGLGQRLAEMPSETLIAENIASVDQGKVYGFHFAFSHLWWAIAYPIAGFLGTQFPNSDFLYGGILTLTCGVSSILIFKPSFKSLNQTSIINN